MGLFDERNLLELEHPDFPGERLVACRNPELANKRANKRESLLGATAAELEKVRPIRHRLENRVRAHIFLCMLAYYVQWHMSEAWRPLLYADEDQRARGPKTRGTPSRPPSARSKPWKRSVPNCRGTSG